MTSNRPQANISRGPARFDFFCSLCVASGGTNVGGVSDRLSRFLLGRESSVIGCPHWVAEEESAAWPMSSLSEMRGKPVSEA